MTHLNSIIRSRTFKGGNRGLMLQPHDATRIQLIARWYCLSAGHVMRHEQPITTWHPDYVDYGKQEVRKKLHRMEYAVRRRLSALTGITDHPPLGSAAFRNQKAGWWATSSGARLVDAPWTNLAPAHWQHSEHAWAAADVGMQIERMGHHVMSERELATGKLVSGAELTSALTSTYIAPSGSSVQKRPDVAIVAPHDQRYIAVEVERDRNRPLSTYRDKLLAYRNNPNVTCVWYVCGQEATARRVDQAATQALGAHYRQDPSFGVRIAPLAERGGFYEVHGLEENEHMSNDLQRLG